MRTDHNWIMTFSGRKFWPTDPSPEDIDIVDIAHALSKVTRYTGHTQSIDIYCPTLDQRVLTENLEWVAAGDLRAGDHLLAFDEYGQTPNRRHNRRKLKPSVITFAEPVRKSTFRISLSDGSCLTSSREHPWLTASSVSRNYAWTTAEEINQRFLNGQKTYLSRILTPWDYLQDRESGWLAGIFDGEGSISINGRRGHQLSITQNPGHTLSRIRNGLWERGFRFNEGRSKQCDVHHLQITGGWREAVRLLGQIRPDRLLLNFKQALWSGLFDKQLYHAEAPLHVVNVEDTDEQWVMGIETSTHTYFCEGFCAHNSVAQHCVYVAEHCPPEFALEGLLHDANEAYLCDHAKPIKPELPDCQKFEDQLDRCIAEKFNLVWPIPEIVKIVDRRMLVTEAKQLMHPNFLEWKGYNGYEPIDLGILEWPSWYARLKFLRKFEQLTRRR